MKYVTTIVSSAVLKKDFIIILFLITLCPVTLGPYYFGFIFNIRVLTCLYVWVIFSWIIASYFVVSLNKKLNFHCNLLLFQTEKSIYMKLGFNFLKGIVDCTCMIYISRKIMLIRPQKFAKEVLMC